MEGNLNPIYDMYVVLLHARHCSKYLKYMNVLRLLQQLSKIGAIIIPILLVEQLVQKILSNLPQITACLTSCGARI